MKEEGRGGVILIESRSRIIEFSMRTTPSTIHYTIYSLSEVRERE